MRYLRRACRLPGLVLLIGCVGAAAQSYPSKPVRVIEAFGAGGPVDILMRGIGQALQQSLGVPFVIDLRPGGDGIIGTEACARAVPDGYTICPSATNVLTIGPGMHTKLPFDPVRDFVPVARIGILDSAMVVHPSVPANTVKELIELARAKPEQIVWASFGVNTSSYMYMEWVRKVYGAPFLHVPYKTAPQSQNATLAGEAQVNLYTIGSALVMAKAKKLKILAVTGEKRSAFAPEYPSFKEAGIDLPWRTWYGVLAPAGTPNEIVHRLNASINAAIADPAVAERAILGQGITPATGTPDEFAAFLKSDRELFARMMAVIGVKPVD